MRPFETGGEFSTFGGIVVAKLARSKENDRS
jgi:hypothetical protein